MRRQAALCLTTILLCAASGVAQAPATRTDIRKIDFLNFAYQSSLCSKDFGKKGIGKIVNVQKGEFKNAAVYFAVDDTKIVYGDVTGDGNEEAIVPVSCGAMAANFSLTEIYVFTMKSDGAALLAEITDKDLERDYRGYYPDAESYWGLAGNDLRVRDGNLEIDVYVDGPHAAPQYVATLQYAWKGEGLQLVGKPQRKATA